jgi:hypothetical protein
MVTNNITIIACMNLRVIKLTNSCLSYTKPASSISGLVKCISNQEALAIAVPGNTSASLLFD